MTVAARWSYLRSVAHADGARRALRELERMGRRAVGGRRLRRAARPRVEWGRGVTIDGRLRLVGHGTIVVGDHVHVVNAAGVPTEVVVQGGGARVELGPGCSLNGTTINCLTTVRIGAGCVLGTVHVLDADFHALTPEGRRSGRPGAAAPVVIEDHCWLAAGAVVLKGVTIGRGSVVGAGAVVRDDVPPRSLVLGNPAAVVASL